jgi:hypothetical protein
MMFQRAILGGHENPASRAAIAYLQAENIAVESDRALDVANINADVTQRSDFRHKTSFGPPDC